MPTLGAPAGTVICGGGARRREPGRVGRDRVRIETYFANAERAREIEDSIARGQLYVVVDLDGDGSARIERLEGSGGQATIR